MRSDLFRSELLMAHEPERATTDIADGRGSDRSSAEDLPIREIRVIRGGRFMGSSLFHSELLTAHEPDGGRRFVDAGKRKREDRVRRKAAATKRSPPKTGWFMKSAESGPSRGA